MGVKAETFWSEQMFGEIVQLRISTLANTNLVVSRHFEKDKTSLTVNPRC